MRESYSRVLHPAPNYFTSFTLRNYVLSGCRISMHLSGGAVSQKVTLHTSGDYPFLRDVRCFVRRYSLVVSIRIVRAVPRLWNRRGCYESDTRRTLRDHADRIESLLYISPPSSMSFFVHHLAPGCFRAQVLSITTQPDADLNLHLMPFALFF